MALVKIAAVVVPSPTSSFVLDETDLTRFAPIFNNLSVNSILFATVTPSLVILGPPNDYSITTFLPLGPKVTYTASASLSTPFRIYSLALTLNLISLAEKQY